MQQVCVMLWLSASKWFEKLATCCIRQVAVVAGCSRKTLNAIEIWLKLRSGCRWRSANRGVSVLNSLLGCHSYS